MKLTYIILLAQQGDTFYGTGEKVKEVTLQSERMYEGKNRTQITVNGHITKRYFGKDSVIFHVEEAGQQRKSSAVYSFTISNSDSLIGSFISTVAASEGTAKCQRGNSKYYFSGKVG